MAYQSEKLLFLSQSQEYKAVQNQRDIKQEERLILA